METDWLSQIWMTIKWECVPVAPLKRRLHALLGPVTAVRVGLYRKCGATLDTLCPVSHKRLHASSSQFPEPAALPAQILGSYLRASHVHAVVQRVHLCAAQVDRVDQLVRHGLMSMRLAPEVVLAQKYLGKEAEADLPILCGVETGLKVRVGLPTALQVPSPLHILPDDDANPSLPFSRMVSSKTPNPPPACLSPQSVHRMNPGGGSHPMLLRRSSKNWIVTLRVSPLWT
eukprot:CAMPEP_0183311638 /NCGR_PEP_ID=MMETSP0160_2-20130417/38099_1 /TAXON_ID=2839 ORGANISM="Odontella Sinensis, Strain Grunow 1884" /NCGR_SAMPLE_ID=MMETSP0160_2 /ASSEMBLY_ACC=CAM_ASM_000250 /LENGTH=229 /DNA_ID=CAMNT_0025476271 /DNA_START=354 /DNA_END=1044 /DNA_ORIENTATION=-